MFRTKYKERKYHSRAYPSFSFYQL